MAFDEAYHLSIIKLFSKQWSPLFLHQPPGMATYGALTRDPSYLHHYLLSFPYRLLVSLGANEFTTVVTLRFLNIIMFAVGLLLFRKLLLATRASTAAIHAALFFFVMIPTVPLLAGQINYDNLQFPLMAGTILLAVKFTEKLRAKKFDLPLLLLTIIVSILGTLNKFTFLPVITAIAIYLAVVIGRFYLKDRKQTLRLAKTSWRATSLLKRRVLLASLAVTVGLFMWSYGVNLVVYKNPVAQCHQVLGPARCQTYGPWARNYKFAQENKGVNPNPILFTLNWLGGMQYRLFFTINGATGPELYTNDTAPVVTAVAGLLTISGLVLFVRFGRRMLSKDYALRLMLFVVVVYSASVWGRNYSDYLHLGQMVAINGRYLQPLLMPVILVLIASFQWAFRLMPAVKLGILAASFILFLSGGGSTSFIHYSDMNWYFEKHDIITHMNDFAKKLVAPFFLWRS